MNDNTYDIITQLETDRWHWKLSNVIPGSDPIVYELRLWKEKETHYACEYTIERAFNSIAEMIIR